MSIDIQEAISRCLFGRFIRCRAVLKKHNERKAMRIVFKFYVLFKSIDHRLSPAGFHCK
jgi:hypothetical protein